MSQASGSYYLPEPSKWPIIGSIGMFTMLFGFASSLSDKTPIMGEGNLTMMYIGMAIIIFMLFGWFGQVIRESESGVYNSQVDISFRMGMMWFIFSEVMFFAAFFGALYYIRTLSVPWLGGADNNAMTNEILYNGFVPSWPLNVMPDAAAGGFNVFKETIGAWGIPALNTALLLTSGVTVTLAHWALKKGNRGALTFWLFATVVLGFTFVGFQAYEYIHAYSTGLKLSSGVYGSTFFMLTGFHGLHVTIGAIMLTVMMFRSMKGHFTDENHFAFEAAAWYWHFVDVVWLGLFIFVYVL